MYIKKMFVILANAAWDSGGMGGNSSQQYTRTLAKLGWDGIYVDPSGTLKFKDINRIRHPHQTVVMCDFPYSEYFMKIFSALSDAGCHSVCRIVDHWKAIDILEDYNPELEIEFVKSADHVFASNPLNVERFKSVRPDIQLLRNGVDLNHFDSAQGKEQITLARGWVTLGVVASFWFPKWADLKPLLHYARRHPEDTVNIIGNAKAVMQDQHLGNVIVHKPKHWREIPQYIHQFDICVVPYNPETTKYTNPIKVLEYLACGKPIVSCYNPSIADFPYVYFYEGVEDFENAVEKALANPIDKDYLMNFLKNHTWNKRVETILNKLEMHSAFLPR
jgi:glycosyltransferase involved in cell wall biosynthesis